MSAAYFFSGLRVRIHALHGVNAPTPSPEFAGFSENAVYPVIGVIEHDPSGEMFLVLPNNKGEIWRLSNRHVRYVAEDSESNDRPTYVDPELWAKMQYPE